MKRNVFTLLLFVCAFAGLKAQTVFSEHEDAKWGVALGYVSKDWRTDFGSDEEFTGVCNGRMLHDIRLYSDYRVCLHSV